MPQKKSRKDKAVKATEKEKCGREDSNLHSINWNMALNHARLPVPPRPQSIFMRTDYYEGWFSLIKLPSKLSQKKQTF